MSVIKKSLSYSAAIIVGYVSLICFLGDPGKGLLEQGVTEDILLRKNFLVKTLSRGPLAADLFNNSEDQFAGEWTMGAYAMATYALTNIAMINPETAKESSQTIAKWIKFCLSDKMVTFDKNAWGEAPLDEKVLNKDEGHIGYYGHLNLMLGCYALLNSDGKFKGLHTKLSTAIAKRMAKYPHRHIETYPGETYTPDNTVAAASLRVADMTLGEHYKKLVDEWVEQSKKIEYAPYGLIAFQIDIKTGKPMQPCRGSNIGWNSFFLPMVDESYAQIQFNRFTARMFRRFMGLAAFREYPKGGWFKSDVDTGPVIFGIGGTATALSVAGARWTNNQRMLSSLLRSVDLIAVSVVKGNEKRYLASPIVGDAIMLAMKTACRWKPLWKENQ